MSMNGTGYFGEITDYDVLYLHHPGTLTTLTRDRRIVPEHSNTPS